MKWIKRKERRGDAVALECGAVVEVKADSLGPPTSQKIDTGDMDKE